MKNINVGWITLFRPTVPFIFILLAWILLAANAYAQYEPPKFVPQIPVIFDTDIGSDIDDTWALSLILCSPEIDLRMVVTETHDTTARAKIAAKFLETVGQDHIPIGIGIKTSDRLGAQFSWAEDYDLENYAGGVHEDGVGAMIDFIRNSTETVTLIVSAPCPNLPELLRRAPGIMPKIRVVAMSGSIEHGYEGNVTPDAEFNVRESLAAAKALYSANWDLTIAPLDTAGKVAIRGAKYQELYRARNPVFETLMENYRTWIENGKYRLSADARSPILYDCTAVYLAFDLAFCDMKKLNLRVDDFGYTVVDPKGHPVHVALTWKNLGAMEDLIWKRIFDGIPPHIERPTKEQLEQF